MDNFAHSVYVVVIEVGTLWCLDCTIFNSASNYFSCHPGWGHSHWQQYAYARMARVPFWPISEPQIILPHLHCHRGLGFSSNVPQKGFLTPNVCQKRVWFLQWLCQGECRMSKIAQNWPNLIKRKHSCMVLVQHL